jgi:hypothetical protein
MTDGTVDTLDLEAYRVAKEARNLEIALFWQRSNYFLVLSTAIAAVLSSQFCGLRSTWVVSSGRVAGSTDSALLRSVFDRT